MCQRVIYFSYNTHTHTHTQIYIYIYIYIWGFYCFVCLSLFNLGVFYLFTQKADFAAAPMYPTAKRLEVLDFSLPFMSVSASIVIRKQPDGSHLQFTSIQDIYLRETIYIGMQGRGLIYRAIRSSNSSFVRKLYDRMQSTRRLSFTDTNEQGLERVRSYNYAFILPNPIAEYVANRKPCDLHVIGTNLFRHQFAFATPKGSSLLPFLSNGLRLLRDSGDLDAIYRRWWIDKGDCSSDNKRHVQKTMRYEHVTTSGTSSAGRSHVTGLFFTMTSLFVGFSYLSA